MAHTLTVLTLWLAQAIGLYFVAAGLGLLRRPAIMAAMIDDIDRSPSICHAFGVAGFVVGVAILIPHHVTYDPLALIVTLFGLITAIEGVLLLVVPGAIVAVGRPLIPHARLLAIVAIILGLILFLAGFTGRADAIP